MAISTPTSITPTPMADNAGGTVFTLNTTGTVPSAGTVVIPVFWLASTPRTLAITSTGVSPAVVGTPEADGNYGEAIWRCYFPSGASNPSFTLTFSGAVTHVNAPAFYSTGVDSAAPDDGNGGGRFRNAALDGTWSSGAVSFASTGEVLQVVIAASDNSGTGRTATTTAPFTELFDWENASALQSTVAYRIVTNPGSTTASGTWSSPSDFADQVKIVALKADTGGGGGASPFPAVQIVRSNIRIGP